MDKGNDSESSHLRDETKPSEEEERVVGRVSDLGDCASGDEYVLKMATRHQREEAHRQIFLEQTRAIAQGDVSKLVKLFVEAHILKAKEYIPSPQGIFAASSMNELSGAEEEAVANTEVTYHKRLYAFNLRFLQEFGSQIPLSVWAEFLSEAIVESNIDLSVAAAMGYDLSKLHD